MRETILPADGFAVESSLLNRLDRTAKGLLLSLLGKLHRGRLHIRDGPQRLTFGDRSWDGDLEAEITVRHSRFYSKTVFGGSVGAGEAYMSGHWSADDLTAVFRIVLLNRDLFLGLDRGLARVKAPVYKLFHLLHRGSKKKSRSNITAHYDLGNAFYALFLDETMAYSCGIFETQSSTLKEASLAKFDRICRKLALSPADHVLEIGTGWGGFAVYAVENYGCKLTTTTISKAQHDLALKRIKEAGVHDRVTLLLEDYRDLKGRYDKLVSIEMIEAVGHRYLDTFFSCCSNLLNERGAMLIQAITISDQAFERHKKDVDFIKRYIFPGSCIPSVTAIGESIAASSDLRLFHLEDITPHYARTLRTWRERFFSHIDAVRGMGYSEAFIRMWEFYLSYCEAGFEERYLGDVQMLFTKPLCRREPLLPEIKRSFIASEGDNGRRSTPRLF